ncbi:MAG: M55 family metallopeptidase, partial [Clostridiales bacterium]|nr:M55 family metallopeptidase [Clostridiales bacterium]
MKICISVDMEGISGINTKEHVLSDARLYGEARRMLTEDINAAVRGAFAGGADEVIVMDMHGSSNNVLTELLDERALLLVGTPHFPRFPFLNGSDGLFLVGYHAQAGTERGSLEHTMT